jgi:hypothetical protein
MALKKKRYLVWGQEGQIESAVGFCKVYSNTLNIGFIIVSNINHHPL